jgi:HD domain-containing protein/GAF domain-containing protein
VGEANGGGLLVGVKSETRLGELTLLSGLLEASRLMKGEADPEQLYWRVVETILRTADADGCALCLESESEERLLVRAEGRLERRHILRGRAVDGETLGNQILRGGGEARVVRAIDSKSAADFPPYVARSGFRSAALLPVLGKTGTIGVLSAYYFDTDRPAENSLETLSLVNQVASVALENANLYRQVQRSYFSTIEALASAIDAASPATHGHSKRVTQFALVLGEAIGIGQREMTTLQYGALLHDIGKLGVPTAILEKNAALSADEIAAVREHPVIGERIIAPVDFLQPARLIVRHHHERWDGQGYPDRLRGEEIPLGARIVALADFYDAMISARPYKRGMEPQEVAGEIRLEIGKRFDPDLAEIFLKMVLSRS